MNRKIIVNHKEFKMEKMSAILSKYLMFYNKKLTFFTFAFLSNRL